MAGVSNYLFGRAYQLDLQAPGGKSISFGNLTGKQSALRISFDLDKKAASAPNKGQIAVFNLNAKTRGAITQGWFVRLRCGYNALVETVFVGRVGIVNHQRQGPDIVTSLNCVEGFTALMDTKISKAYPPKTTLVVILRDLAKLMATPINVVRNLPNTTYDRGISLNSNCRDALETLLRPLKVTAHISNGKLNILPDDLPFGSKAIVISQETGMIETPTVDKRSLQVTCLLITALCTPGQLVQIKTGNSLQNGFWIIRSCKVEGDSHDAKWSVSLTCARLIGYDVKALSNTGITLGGGLL